MTDTELLNRYNYDAFVPEKFEQWMKFDHSPALGALHGLFTSLQEHITGVYSFCATAFGVKTCATACGVKLLGEYAGDLQTQESQAMLTDSTAKAGAWRVWVGRKHRGEVALSRTDETGLRSGSIEVCAMRRRAVAVVRVAP